MLYLLDANVLIDANRDYYSINRVPEFWDWLVSMGTKNFIKIPIEVVEEIKEGTDSLTDWLKETNNYKNLSLNEEVDSSLVARVIDQGYANDLTDDEVEKIGRDPFLIAYALSDVSARCIVTTENSRPKRKRANRHLPDVCNHFSVKWYNTFDFLRLLDFRTNWRS